MFSMRTSLLFPPARARRPVQPARLAGTIPPARAPVLFMKRRRVIMFQGFWCSACVRKNEIEKISHVLAGQSFLQSLRHERGRPGLKGRDLRSGNDRVIAERLPNR